MNQKHKLLVVESISQAVLDGSRCEMLVTKSVIVIIVVLTTNTQVP
jgi:hypothetical protein